MDSSIYNTNQYQQQQADNNKAWAQVNDLQGQLGLYKGIFDSNPALDKIRALLGSQSQIGLPDKQNYIQNAAKNINASANTAVANTKADVASQGLGRSGIGLAAVNGVNNGRYAALGNAANQVNQMDASYKQNALNQLLGLEEYSQNSAQSQFNANRDYGLRNKALDQQQQQFLQNLDFQMNNQPDPWASILGSLIGAGGQIGAAALGA